MVTLKVMTPEQLKQWRAKHGYTQQRLADALGVFRESIVRWETGVRNFPPFLHLALRCLELERGERKSRDTKTKKERKVKRHGSNLPKR
jgi:DNA-binding XRE family transcriptional regulator